MTYEGPSTSASDRGGGKRIGAGAILSIIGVGALIAFIVQNTNEVQLDFLWWHFSWPLWLLTLVSALLGALVWIGFGIMRRHRRRKERREERRD